MGKTCDLGNFEHDMIAEARRGILKCSDFILNSFWCRKGRFRTYNSMQKAAEVLYYKPHASMITLHHMSHVRRFYPRRLTDSILWAIPTGANWGEVSQGHNDMLTAVGFEPVTPLIPTPTHNPLHHTPPVLITCGSCTFNLIYFLLHFNRMLWPKQFHESKTEWGGSGGQSWSYSMYDFLWHFVLNHKANVSFPQHIWHG